MPWCDDAALIITNDTRDPANDEYRSSPPAAFREEIFGSSGDGKKHKQKENKTHSQAWLPTGRRAYPSSSRNDTKGEFLCSLCNVIHLVALVGSLYNTGNLWRWQCRSPSTLDKGSNIYRNLIFYI